MIYIYVLFFFIFSYKWHDKKGSIFFAWWIFFKIDNKLLNLAFAQIFSRPVVNFNEDWIDYFFSPLFDPRHCTYILWKSWLETESSLII